MATRKKYTFEQAMERLEEIVQLLEQGDAPLAQSMTLFEEGTKISAQLHQMLSEAEQTVHILTKSEDGEFDEQLFDAGGDTQ